MRVLSAGFSHSGIYSAVVEGLPSGIKIDVEYIEHQLFLRRFAPGRSARMNSEGDELTIFSGVLDGKTTGAPLAFGISTADSKRVSFTAIRPGHADYPAAVKYGYTDLSFASERTSARETVNTVAVGAICALALKDLGIKVVGKAISLGGKSNESEWSKCIEMAWDLDDTVGGRVLVTVSGVYAGLGGGYSFDKKLDGRLAGALMSLPAVKAVEIGIGREFEYVTGRRCAEETTIKGGITRYSGGIDGGMANGTDIELTVTVKPIPTLQIPVDTVDIVTKKNTKTTALRADVTAVFAAAVCAEAAVAAVIFDELQTNLGGDTIEEMIERIKSKRQNDFINRE